MDNLLTKCAKEANIFFEKLQDFTTKLTILFHFDKIDQCVLEVEINHACSIIEKKWPN